MVMSLDDAILHAEEVAEEKEKDARFYTFSRPDEYRKESCEKCADEHRQLAGWLKDYKRLLERESCEDAISRKEVIDTIYHECSGERLDIDFGKALDKIRAEIERERSFQRVMEEYDIATGLRKALEIIDKYKAESEEEK